MNVYFFTCCLISKIVLFIIEVLISTHVHSFVKIFFVDCFYRSEFSRNPTGNSPTISNYTIMVDNAFRNNSVIKYLVQ